MPETSRPPLQSDTLSRLDGHWRDRFADFSALVSDGLWETDAAGMLIYLSPRAETMLGIRHTDGDMSLADRLKSRFEILPGGDPFGNALERLSMHLQRHIPFRTLPLDMADGGRVILSGLPVFDPLSGRFSGFRGTIRDTGRERALLRQEQNLAHERRAFAEQRRALYSALGHELRTPLNSMIGFLECFEHEIYGPLANKRYRNASRDLLQEARALLERLQIMLQLARGLEPPPEKRTGWRIWPVARLIGEALRLLAYERRFPAPCVNAPLPDDLAIACDGELMKCCFARLILAMMEITPGSVCISLEHAGSDERENLALIITRKDSSQGCSATRHIHGAGSGHPLGGEGTDSPDIAFVREIIARHGGRLLLRADGPGYPQAICHLPRAAAPS